ncbi:MAG: hypothetical protein JSS81_21535 [Acidobacteria bacterium]|nr:hypothetical protein [Acidobacteriota bacterium]
MTQREHARLIGLLLWIYVGLQLAITGLVTVMMFFMSGAMLSQVRNLPHKPGEPDPTFIFTMLPFIMIFAFLIAVVMMIPKIVAGYGLRKEKSWAKTWAIIGCALACLNIPFGLAIGIYGFWFIFGEAGRGYFDNPSTAGTMNAPPPNNWQ